MANLGIQGFEIALDNSLRTNSVVAGRKAKLAARHAKRPAARTHKPSGPKAKR